MKYFAAIKPLLTIAVVAGIGVAGYVTREQWLPYLNPTKREEEVEPNRDIAKPSTKILVNEQAQLNLGLIAKPVKAQTYWKSIPVPGMVVERQGFSDRSVVTPATAVVTSISHFPGDTVQPGDVLFTLKILSESLHLTQTELVKASLDLALAQTQRKRLNQGTGVVSESRLIEVESQIARLQVVVATYRQELLNRGFSEISIDGIASGKLVNEIKIVTPARPTDLKRTSQAAELPATYELQELKVELGQQVQAGQTLCLLANHQSLAVEGRAFRDETPLLERSVKEKWPVDVDFQEDPQADWGGVAQTFQIRHMANTIDPTTRTFAFLIPLENQSRAILDDERTQTLWRFRPGQKVRIMVRVEKLDNVFVLPADAVTRDGVDAFAFTQNVNTFERKSIRVVLQDRQRVVVANDGSLAPGSYVVQVAAAQLNRLVKAGSASGAPKGFHMHADGSLHKNHDEDQ